MDPNCQGNMEYPRSGQEFSPYTFQASSVPHETNQNGDPNNDNVRLEAEAEAKEKRRKEKKKIIDKKHREKKKEKMTNLEKKVEELSKANQRFKKEIKRMNKLADRAQAHIQGQKENMRKIQNSEELLSSDDSEQWIDSECKKFIEMNESTSKGPGTSQAITCGIYSNTPVSAFLRRLDADEESRVDYSNFTDLTAEQNFTFVGKYCIPNVLVPIATKINQVHVNVCANIKISPLITLSSYTVVCSTIKEMSEVPLKEVTEERMLIWRDAIKDALRLNFNVEFAMEHLKKIAHGYFGLKAENKHGKSCDLDGEIVKLEAHLKELKEDKKCIEIAQELVRNPVGAGLWC